ncbi:MAG: DNA topoisomerase VI subunit B [Pirellulales bacterium]
MKRSPAKSAATRVAKHKNKPESEADEAKSQVESGGDAQATDVPAAKPSAAKRRSTAEKMAEGQRDISVSEFFAKNRHLLGFDNPRKALLTTVKEAVDNSLDACEEAGILPEIWVHLEQTGTTRFKIGIQDNGPGIVKKQIPLIFGKLLYGSKFHRLRMSRGQQGIGISAAGMYGVLTTGKPVKIISKIGKKHPAHYYEIQINTKTNNPEILNGKGEGVDIASGPKMQADLDKHKVEWVAVDDAGKELESGTRVTIELEAIYKRGRGSIDEYLEQTAIANPHVRIHFKDSENNERLFDRSATTLPPEAKEIKPHPYGIELGRLIAMLKDTRESTVSAFLSSSFSRVSSAAAKKVCDTAKISTRMNPGKAGRNDAENLFKALQEAKLPPPSTDCIIPIGEELLLKGLHQVVPGEFYAAATRPPAVYRGNPFQIEAALAFGGSPAAQRVSLEALTELLGQSDARTLRQFLTSNFAGLGSDAADKIIAEAEFGARQSPGKLKKDEIAKLHEAMRSVNLDDGQTMNVLRYANRVPLQFQLSACAITQTIMQTNWRSYGITQSRNALPSGPISLMVHIASVWVPFTSESKEAVASYPEIQKEIRLAIQTIGRKLGMFLRRRMEVKAEGERRNVFLRYLGEVADAVSEIRDKEHERDSLYNQLLEVAKKKTAQADAKYDNRGKKIEDVDDLENDKSVLIIPREDLAVSK